MTSGSNYEQLHQIPKPTDTQIIRKQRISIFENSANVRIYFYM